MKQWFRENKIRIILSSSITLLPILFGLFFWNQLPDVITTHWGADGVADGFSEKAFAIFVPTGIIFAINLLCIFATAFDNNSRNQNKKVFGIVYWILPIISLLINGVMYNIAFTGTFDFDWIFFALIGVLYVVFGNYMPKIKQNRTFGIKISWTMNNEENWNKTHRVAGKLWVAGGVALLIAAFLPIKWAVACMFAIFAITIITPIVYSYTIYFNHKKQGILYINAPKTKTEKVAVKFTAITVPLILVVVLILMFTGSIQFEFSEDNLAVNATYYEDICINYDEIDSVELRDAFDFGVRKMGYGSAKLSMGVFQNDEFGAYTLYAYTGSKAAVVIKDEDKVLVITGKDSAETEMLYNTLLEKVK